MKKINYKSLIKNLLIPIGSGAIIGFLARKDFNYIDTLNRSIDIPVIVFPIVWALLYILMGIWAYFDEKEYDGTSNTLYYLSLILNLLFVPLLFTFHKILFSLILVSVLLLIIIVLFIKTVRKKYGYLLLPYIIWLVFALVLMIDLFIKNGA